jgi:CheY-like chemotaxis protein
METPWRQVLVVESALTCAEALRQQQFRVTAFPHPEAAFHAARELRSDIIVVHLDDSADRERRLDLLRRLRGDPITTSVPLVIVVEADVPETQMREARSFGLPIVRPTGRDCAGLAEAVRALLSL